MVQLLQGDGPRELFLGQPAHLPARQVQPRRLQRREQGHHAIPGQGLPRR